MVKRRERKGWKVLVDQDEDSKVHSLVGHLGTTDPAGLLQSLSNNRESGVLSVESKDLQFRAIFEQGKLSKAKQGKLKAIRPSSSSSLFGKKEYSSLWKGSHRPIGRCLVSGQQAFGQVIDGLGAGRR